MIQAHPDNLIQPTTKMPVPNEYFFLFFLSEDKKCGHFKPAILKAYCDAKCFYQNCIVFNTDGTPHHMTSHNILSDYNPAGWCFMFEGAKTFKIEYL